MTLEELIPVLIKKGLIDVIDNEYFITETYKDIKKDLPLNDFENLIVKKSNAIPVSNPIRRYPAAISDVKKEMRVEGLITVCDIPLRSKDNSYMLRGYDKKSETIINEYLENFDVDPKLFIKAVTDYYKVMDFPKGLKNFVNDGDLKQVYTLYSSGSTLMDSKQQDSTTWK